MLSGSIPKDFGNLLRLKIMDLSENQLSGPLPESLGKLKYLTTFYVSANNLSGEFPKGYDNLISLKKFSIAGNYISGPLPVETIAKWTNINTLVLVGNNFEGNLTTEIFGLQNLQYLLISDLANNSFQLPPKIANSAKFISLTLRNCSITGPIPEYIGEEMTSLRYLDLSFNKLTGGLPQTMSSNMIDMSFSGNMLDGTIPPWIQLNETIAPRKRGDFQTRIDLSFNNFSAGGSLASSNQQLLNLFACCRNSSTTEPQMMDPFEMKNRYCPANKSEYHSLFINCGGEETTVLGNKYDQDTDTSLFYTSPKENWAYSISGGYGVPESNTSNYIKSMTRGVPITEATEAPLYEKARLSPVSLKYYAFCLLKGNYTVTFYFNEVVYTKKEDYTSLRKRVFDVYIQDVRRLNYVNIREKNGSEPITENISAVVVNDSGLLNIHFYWPGKGSYQYQPSFNGPLISAISVTPEFKISSNGNNGQRVALITLASIVAALPLSLAFAWWMGWLSSKEPSSKERPPTSQVLNPIRNVQEDYKQQAPNQSQFAIVEEGNIEQQAPNQSQFAVVEEGDTEQQAANQSQFAVVEEGDTEQQAANQSQSAVVEEDDTEKYGNKEPQQQPQSIGRGKSSNKGSAVAANQSKFAVVEEGDTEKYRNKERQQQPQSVGRGKRSVAANQSKSTVIEEGDTKKYGNKERPQQPQSVRRGKSSDKGSVLLGEKIIDEVCPPAKPTGDINVVGSLEESAGISDMAESFSPLWRS
ncbi:probable LRR receptor-like serine/threonine-protein kinase At1g53440 isoform X2 [Malus domestica]|uniref:probable LRR receptor-like serine/threonine-protein kinase At1g53440 isoform X2 n=1 Tax=Malus domestica TaxID=3750 RepID=UPI0039761740